MQVYVDDPLAIIRGSPSQQRRMAPQIVVMWSIMGFLVATPKRPGELFGVDWSEAKHPA